MLIYSDVVTSCGPGIDVVLHVTALEFVAMALVPSFLSMNRASWVSRFMIQVLANVLAGCSSRLPLVGVVAWIISALRPSALVLPSIMPFLPCESTLNRNWRVFHGSVYLLALLQIC